MAKLPKGKRLNKIEEKLEKAQLREGKLIKLTPGQHGITIARR